MSATDWVVIFAGLAAVVWVNWYFFFAHRTVVRAESGTGGVQTVQVTVKGGYEPSTVQVRRGIPVRMVFDRQETSSCSEEIVLPAFGVKRFLPAFQKTAIEFIPNAVGEYDFMCGMSMLHGKIIVSE
jgi:plastocyanin domain-containing protein